MQDAAAGAGHCLHSRTLTMGNSYREILSGQTSTVIVPPMLQSLGIDDAWKEAS